MFGSRKILAFIALALLAAGVGTALYESTSVDAMEQSGEKAAPPPMPVDIVEIKAESIEIWNDFSGNVVAVDRAEIRPQVEGRITEIRFIDGQNVQKGDVLFVIDPRTYEAALNQAKAALENAKVQAQLAQKEYERAKSLIKTEAISQSLMDERDNNRKATAAAVQGAEAAVQRAEIDLDFAYVKAPISGRVSRAEITIGNLVQKTPNAP
ncbi:MAG: efflux RND transporter periplasmic adaptor subunit, partial [Alphaproteobacteria bacterium]|nr:efflux RND transporter periplasmic adaptor subunit [Alphaproteobacteria bacterium]